ncbi:BRO1-like domain-containing protein [Pisolithus microcarpus]|nr:BRO1-like domain-containing protein [Pisolithus microcarpus]
MPNHLVIPFKKTYTAPIRSSVRDYILHHTEDHPDAYRSDIAQWESLRVACMNTTAAHHSNDVDAFLKYHAQLVFVLAKLPSDINLEISYAHPFSTSSSIPVTLRSLAFERASVLFNLAALYSQLAAAEDRSSQLGLRRATTYYQSAAGTLSYLSSSALPRLRFPADAEEIPTDLTGPFVRCLENLMLAQAQECAWQRAVADHYKNALIAKLATGVASLYASSLEAIRSAPSTISSSLPSTWMTHIETKQRHFRAAAQYRKSIDDLEANRYGDEIRRLMDAEAEAKQGYSLVKRSSVAPAVIQDIKSLLDALQKNLGRAQRDNDLIYHCDIPASTAADPIVEVIMVKSNVSPGLLDPKSLLGTGGILFGDMLGWGAREAVNIYNDNKRTLVKERVIEAAQVLDDEAERLLRSLNLPASLEALERPIGLPPSLLKKAEEVRLEQGPERIEAYLDDVQRLARRAMAILDEAMDILDNEASEDEAARKEVSLSRPVSYKANRELVAKQQRYRSILLEAAQSDVTVREKWEESEAAIVNLTLDEEELEALVPSTTVSIDGKISRANNQTQIHARALRGLLESLDDIRKDRGQVVARAQRRLEVDDIKPSIISVASNFNRWEELTPAMFVDLSDKELAKYDRFIQELAEGKKQQEGILEAIKSKNEQFLQSRKEDPAVKDREVVLHRLDMAHAKYLEITRNLDEGRKFYNEMASILSRFKEACKLWSNQRSQEAQSFYQSFKSLSIQERPRLPSQKSPNEPAKASAPEQPSPQRRKANIPPLSSTEWEQQEFPPEQRHTHTPSRPKQKANLPSLSSSEWEAQEPPQTPGSEATPSRPKKKANLPSLSSPEWKTEGLVLPPSPEFERQKPAMTLPSLSSAEWETQELPPPPSPPPTERRGAKTPRKQRR